MRCIRATATAARTRSRCPTRYCAMPRSHLTTLAWVGVSATPRRLRIAPAAVDAAEQRLARRRAVRPHGRFEHDAEHAHLLARRDEEAEALGRARHRRLRQPEVDLRDRHALQLAEPARQL